MDEFRFTGAGGPLFLDISSSDERAKMTVRTFLMGEHGTSSSLSRTCFVNMHVGYQIILFALLLAGRVCAQCRQRHFCRFWSLEPTSETRVDFPIHMSVFAEIKPHSAFQVFS